MNKEMNIAIVGLGNIGSYFYKYLRSNKKEIFKKTNVNLNILKVSARNKLKKRSLKKDLLLKSKVQFLKPKIISYSNLFNRYKINSCMDISDSLYFSLNELFFLKNYWLSICFFYLS